MRPKKILIIDDDLLDIANISQILRLGGYKTRHTTDQGRAMRAIREVSPDLVICKLNVRRLDAQRFVQKVQRSRRLRSTPFLFLAESLRPAEAAPDILGPKQHLTKPFSREQLLIAVQDHLNLRSVAQPRQQNAGRAKLSFRHLPSQTHEQGRIQ